MAIRFKINEHGERVAVVDTVEDFGRAIDELDCPIVAPAEVAAIYGIAEGFSGAEWGLRLPRRRGPLDQLAAPRAVTRTTSRYVAERRVVESLHHSRP